MAPGAVIDEATEKTSSLNVKDEIPADFKGSFNTHYAAHGPLKLAGVLDQYEHFDLTPTIGREFPNANLVEWIESENADELLRDLAITISQRGVVFFRDQHNLTNDQQKQLIHRLGQLAHKPPTSTLHIHPVLNSKDELGEDRDADSEISTISSKLFRRVYGLEAGDETVSRKKQSSYAWHSDVAFEPVPADYTSLRLTQLPSTGGDTLWASGYELYDRLSKPFQDFVASLTCTFAQPNFIAAAARNKFQLYTDVRGAPENSGGELKAIHPVVRTNPVTGWRSLFPVGAHVSHINGVTAAESKKLLDWFNDLLVANHDLQVRFKWRQAGDIAIWDNRSVFHTATYDFEGLGDRSGNRAVGIGERPFLDPKSVSRTEDLESQGENYGRYFHVR